MFVRNPPERVLSAYRNKLEHPLQTNSSKQNLWDEIRFSSLSNYRLKFNLRMAEKKGMYPSFAEFLHFTYDSDPVLLNEHFKPMVDLCHMCAVPYDFVGNFATLRQDANSVLDHIRINSSLFWDKGEHLSDSTTSYIKQYYPKLRPIDIKRFEETFADDIAMYKHLFPSEYDGGYSDIRDTILGDAN